MNHDMKHSLKKFRRSDLILIRSEMLRPDLSIAFGIPITDLMSLEEPTDFDALSDEFIASARHLDEKRIAYEWHNNGFIAVDTESQKWFDFGGVA